MKKNLFLFSILIGLVVFVYYFEELGGIKTAQREKESKQIFNHKSFGALVSFETPSAILINRGDHFVTSKSQFKVDPKKAKKLFEILGGIEIERNITNKAKSGDSLLDRKFFFPKTSLKFKFIFKKGEIEYLIGNKIEVSRSFYVEIIKKDQAGLVVKKWVVAKDSTLDEGIYNKKDFHKNDQKYNRIKSLGYLEESFYYDTRIFEHSDLIITNVKVQNKRNKKFELNVDGKKTNPEVVKGLKSNVQFFDTFFKNLGELKGDSVLINLERDQLHKKVSEITLRTKNSSAPYILSLFKEYKNVEGYYLIKKGESWVYKLNKKSASIFFSNVQDFWDKRLINKNSIFGKSTKGSEFKLIFSDSKKYLFNLKRVGKLHVKNLSSKKEPQLTSFRELIGFLTQKAERVSVLEDLSSLKDVAFKFSLGEGVINVLIKKGEILLLNENLKYVLHYPLKGRLPFSLLQTDYLKE